MYVITSSLQLLGTGRVAAGYSVGYGGLLRGLDVLAVPVQECHLYSQCIVSEGG